jgi:beta-lactamase regulating signal transducer with metallopeptidase domain/thiol-disulfide isomerase/thioredoxin
LAVGGGLNLLWARWPARAHRALVLAIVACLVTPLFSQIVRTMGWGVLARSSPVFHSAPTIHPPASVTDLRPTEQGPAASISTEVQETSLSGAVNMLKESIGSEYKSHSFWKTIPLWIWGAISAVAFLRLLLALVQGFRLVTRGRVVGDKEIQQAAHQAAKKLGLKITPEIYSSEDVFCPLIWCFSRRPVLLLPNSLVDEDPSVNWDGVLCHELGHLKRRDHLTTVLAEVLVCFLPWQPLAWWAKKRLGFLSERACDEWVLECGESATTYAKSLLGLCPQMNATLALSAVTHRKALHRRISDILQGARSNPRPGHYWAWGAAMLTVCMVTAIAFAQQSSKETVDSFLVNARNASIRSPSIRTVDCIEKHQGRMEQGSKFFNIEKLHAILVIDSQKADIKIQRIQYSGDEEIVYLSRAIWDGEKYLYEQSIICPEEDVDESKITSLTDSHSGILTWQDAAGGFLEGRFRCDIGTGFDWIDVLQSASDEDVQIVSSECDIDGHTCVELLAHIEDEERDKTYHLWVDPHNGYLIRRANIVITEDHLLETYSEDPEALRRTRREYYIDDVTIEKISNFFVPTKGKKDTKFFYNDGTVETTHIEVVVSEFEFNPDFEAIGAFDMGWPEDAFVRDIDTGIRYRWDNTPRQFDRVVKDPVNPEEAIDMPGIFFILPQLDGKPIKLSDIEEKVVILQFWTTWAPLSAETLSIVENVANEYEDRGVAFVAISVREQHHAVRKFLRKNKFDFLVGLDIRAEMGIRYRTASVLETMLLDEDRIIRSVFVGGEPDLENKLKKELDCLLE